MVIPTFFLGNIFKIVDPFLCYLRKSQYTLVIAKQIMLTVNATTLYLDTSNYVSNFFSVLDMRTTNTVLVSNAAFEVQHILPHNCLLTHFLLLLQIFHHHLQGFLYLSEEWQRIPLCLILPTDTRRSVQIITTALLYVWFPASISVSLTINKAREISSTSEDKSIDIFKTSYTTLWQLS